MTDQIDEALEALGRIEEGEFVETGQESYFVRPEESDVEAIRQALERQNRLQQWIHDLQAGMYINCVYCGHRYGPDDEVPATMADALKQHIEQCPEHPLNDYRELLQAARVGIGRLHGMTNDQGDLITDIDALLNTAAPDVDG